MVCVGVAVERKVDVDMLNAVKRMLADVSSVSPSSEASKKDCSDEGLTLETSANTLFMAFSISTSTFCFYILCYTPCSQACKHTSLQFGINYRTTVPKMSGTVFYTSMLDTNCTKCEF